jgi:putative ABC transport system permease protein
VVRNTAAFKMLFHDRATALGSIAGVIAIFFLVGQQLTIFFGLLNYMSVLVDISNADIWILSKNSDNANAAGTIPTSYRDRIAGIDGVGWVEPLVMGAGLLRRQNGNYQAVQIVGLQAPRLAGAPNRFQEGSIDALLDYESVTVDHLDLATLDSASVGDRLEINGQRVRIGAITKGVRGFAGNIVFANLNKALEITGLPPDRCSSLLVGVEERADVSSMIVRLRKALPRADVYSTTELSRLTRVYYLRNTGIGGSFGFSTVLGALVGVVIIALTMYTSVLNKTNDYAMLRALGARRRDVFLIIFIQTLYIAGIGILVGLTLLSMFLLGTRDSGLPSYMPWWVPPAHAVFTLFLCLLGSVAAMRRAVRIEPATAFR